ncbi:hypothetical protein DKM44_12610 [Deinococcus irradiatisoli]|uniref:Uncharacterized protein n=1 Tax=Deinococcus irradiatisoli TaxID=2202254 RepID=A0A2Z3JTM6_9DEIO|nr:hypothetical protein [Deinococcus irradiatisoli]AWN23964.1 hypothetical protein DKM44_12610 [Deinococcus irradiatisoli]
MNRAQYLQLCILTSLRKRLWWVLLLAVVVVAALSALHLPLRLGLGAALLLILALSAAIGWSSYLRHQDDHGFNQRRWTSKTSF